MVNRFDYSYPLDAEDLEEYGEGGLYPIHINDEFQDGRYEILNKLGSGGFATVWAARDHHDDTNVAIKIIQAKHSENNNELRVLQHIKQDTSQHPGLRHLPKLFDHFYEAHPDFPESKSLFLVLELLGPTVRDVRFMLPPTYQFSVSRQRQLSRQLVLAVDYLHSQGIAHGDVYYGNVLFRLPDGDDEDDEDENDDDDKEKEDEDADDYLREIRVVKHEITRKDGAPLEKGIPRYLVEAINFHAELDDEVFKELDHIQLIDFSGAFFDEEPPESLYTPIPFSPPELIFNKPLSKSIDIWGLAGVAFYFAFGRPIFEAMGYRRDIFPQIYKATGESSAPWLLTALIEATRDDDELKILPDYHWYQYSRTLEESLSMFYREIQDYPDDKTLSDAEKKHLKLLENYLRKALVVDPSKRPTPKELEAEEWIQIVTD